MRSRCVRMAKSKATTRLGNREEVHTLGNAVSGVRGTDVEIDAEDKIG